MSEEEKKEKQKYYEKIWRENNKQKIKQYSKERYLKNRNLLLNKAKSYYKENKDKILQKRPTKHPRKTKEERAVIYKAKQRLLAKSWKERNRDRNNELHKNWRERNKNKIKIIQKKYINNNPLVAKAQRLKRRDRSISVKELISSKLLSLTYDKFNYKCFKCNSMENLTIDHHYPLSKGFPLSPENSVILCRSCNSKKGKILPELFYTSEQLKELHERYGIMGNNKINSGNKQLSLFNN